MAYTPSPIATPSPTTTPTIAATTPAEMDHRPVNPVDPVGPPIPARRTHRRPSTTDQMSPSESTTNASGTRPVVIIPNLLLNCCDHYINVFADIYVRPRNELTKSLHVTMVEKSQSVLQESTFQLPSDTPIESVDPPEDAGFHISEARDLLSGDGKC
ncbi:hypothetical protein D8674_011460 [Pyrus ussuriensis x Pyrus communis]|uniref:Uncharacterized protein n=1 Tax=Pyrus ussuriensis x Pyrus communis TaxID=2448454 RepID=A0A5N5G4E2_9ROSA|nr:hypothetical protein D8674_011460 [Pyrus ussuriensis x Pyrus communis]